jgi:hypothetical protein
MVSGQISKLAGTFFSNDQDRISLNKGRSGIMFENREMFHLYFEKQFQSNDTLILTLTENSDVKDKEYTFKVLSLAENYFTLIPLSKSSKNLFNNRKEVIFYREGYIVDSTISFEKLIFFEGQSNTHYSDGIALQIDSAKNVFFHYNSAFDTIKSGKFKGKLTEKGYQDLIQILRKVNLKELFWPPSDYYGQAPKKLILYFNGQRKELNSVGDSPYITMSLILFLKNIQLYSEVTKTTDELKFSK